MSQFDRIASLIIGEEGSSEAIQVQDLRIGFSVTKTNDKTTNKGQVTVYNLNLDTQNKLDRIEGFVTLQAGYVQGDGLQNVFTGDITVVSTRYEPPDVITTIQCNDGFRKLRDSRGAFSYAAGTKVQDVLSDLLSRFNIARKSNSIDVPDFEYVNGVSFGGPVKTLLDKLMGTVGYVWSFQDGELKFYPKNEEDQTEAFRLTSETGLIKAPEKVSDVSGQSKDAGAKPGWNVMSVLLPSIEPGNPVRISSIALPTPTNFVVERVEHRGDTWGAEYVTSLLVKEL